MDLCRAASKGRFFAVLFTGSSEHLPASLDRELFFLAASGCVPSEILPG